MYSLYKKKRHLYKYFHELKIFTDWIVLYVNDIENEYQNKIILEIKESYMEEMSIELELKDERFQ